MRNAQNTRPIGIAEAFNEASFSQFNPTAIDQHETASQTLTFSTLMMPKYQDVLQMPKDILELLAEINDERNKLHFISDIEFSMGRPVIENMRLLIEFVANVIVRRIIDLNQNMQQVRQTFPTDGKTVFTV